MWLLLFVGINAIIFFAINISGLSTASYLQAAGFPSPVLILFSLPVTFLKSVCSETYALTYCVLGLVYTGPGTETQNLIFGHTPAPFTQTSLQYHLFPQSWAFSCSSQCRMPADICASWRPSSNGTPVCNGASELDFSWKEGKKRNHFCKAIPTIKSSFTDKIKSPLLLISSHLKKLAYRDFFPMLKTN